MVVARVVEKEFFKQRFITGYGKLIGFENWDVFERRVCKSGMGSVLGEDVGGFGKGFD